MQINSSPRSNVRPRALLAAAILGGALAPISRAATITWNGPAGNSWATGASWSNGSGPGTGDTAFFGDVGSTNLPGEVTSVLNAPRTIGGLTFSNTVGKFHTLDLATRGLTVTGNLNFNLDQGQNTTTTLRNGPLTVSGAFANINVGRGVAGSSVAIADLTGLSSLTAAVQEIQVGATTAQDANGTLKLAPSNNLTANRITVGGTVVNTGANADGTLTLGVSNTIVTPEFFIANHRANGLVDIVSGGTLDLGSPTQRTVLHLANQNTNTNGGYQGRMLLGNAAVNLHLDSLIAAQKDGGPGGASAHFTGGGSGSINIGTSGARGNVYIANTIAGGSSSATIDWRNLDTLTAHVNDFHIARSQSGNATATVTLPATSTIDVANSLFVGTGTGGTGTLNLGASNTILANEVVVSRDSMSGLVTIRNGGTLNLGSPSRRAALYVAVQNKNSNDLHTGTIDLTGGGTFNAYLADVTVGQRDGIGGGRATGTLLGGNGGSVEVGVAGTSTANFYVARALSGGGPAAGTVDFTGLSSFAANVNTFAIGVANAGSAIGNVKLASSNTISANTILVGSGTGDQTSTLQLGNTNVIQTPQLIIGQDFSGGIVTIRPGGTLALGTPAQRTNLNLATAGSTNTGALFVGTLDMSNATLTAHLGNVVIGSKTLSVGGQQGNFYISSLPGNYVDATSILLGSGTHATGTLRFGGGQLVAGSIAAGIGTANFEWTGGRLGVGTFGTPTIPFNLNNTGTGTLAPGGAGGNGIGTTTIYGNYVQGASAAWHVEIAGNSPSSGNDLVNVSGAATLGGRLTIDLTNNFTPAVGQNYLIANYASRTGSFAFIDPPALPEDVAFTLSTGTTQLQVQMVAPAAKSWISTAASGTWSTAGNWSGGSLPTTSNTISITNGGASAQRVTLGNSTTVHRVALQGTGAPVELEVLEGVRFGVANQIVVGTNATLSGAGEIFGTVVVSGGTVSSAHLERFGTLDFRSGTVELTAGDLTVGSDGVLGGDVTLTTGKHLRVPAGATTIDAGASLNVAGGTLVTNEIISHGTTTLGATQEVAALTVGAGGRVTVAPGGGKAIVTSAVAIDAAGGAKLDLSDNVMVVRDGDIGTFDGSTYSGLTGLIQAAHDGGAWTGPGGITTGQSDAATGLTALAIATAAQARGLDDGGTTTWSGVSVSHDDVLVMYTYAGDANLDGAITGDDYSAIDFGILFEGMDGYANGDFNYDGYVTGDDYSVIDLNILLQGPQFPTAGTQAASLSGVTAVPEPSACGFALLAATSVLTRRRRASGSARASGGC